VAGAVLAFAVIAVVFVELLPRIADYGDVWSVLTTLGPAEVAALAIRACGGGSLMRNLPLEQHYRDARCGSVMLPWSAEVCLELLGRYGLYDEPDDHRHV